MPSIAISRIGYDPATRQLTIDLITNGRRYVYFDVPPEIHSAFHSAFAKDTYFSDHIRGHFASELIYDPNWGKVRKAG